MKIIEGLKYGPNTSSGLHNSNILPQFPKMLVLLYFLQRIAKHTEKVGSTNDGVSECKNNPLELSTSAK